MGLGLEKRPSARLLKHYSASRNSESKHVPLVRPHRRLKYILTRSQHGQPSILTAQRRWTQVEKLEVQVTETRKRVLGTGHPDMLTSMANLASTEWRRMQSIFVAAKPCLFIVFARQQSVDITKVITSTAKQLQRDRISVLAYWSCDGISAFYL